MFRAGSDDLQVRANEKVEEIISTLTDIENVRNIEIQVGRDSGREEIIVRYIAYYYSDVPNSHLDEIGHFIQEKTATCFATCVFNAFFRNKIVCQIPKNIICSCHQSRN